MHRHTQRDTHTHQSKWILSYLWENPLFLCHYSNQFEPLFTPTLFSSSLIPPSQPLNNLHPEVEKQLDNKSSLKGHTPTVFMLTSPEQQSNWRVKRPVVLVASQICACRSISGCHSQSDFRIFWGRHGVCLCKFMRRCIQEAWVWGLLKHSSIAQFLQTSC